MNDFCNKEERKILCVVTQHSFCEVEYIAIILLNTVTCLVFVTQIQHFI